MRRQRGIAVITAILVVAVAATAATLMLSQQSAMLDQTMLVASRAQADMYARAGLDWARGAILADSQTSGAFDSLGEPWAQPIAALPVERAVVSGALFDEQGKFNLNNLVVNGKRDDANMLVFQRLLVSLGLAPELADAVADWIDADDTVSGAGAEDAYYLALPKPYRTANQPMVQVEELYRVRGFDAATVEKLRPYVAALPSIPGAEATAVNVNTASAPLLAAILVGVPPDRIAQFVKQRRDQPLRSRQEVAQLTAPLALPPGVDVKSAYFSVIIRVGQDDVELATDALLSRAKPGAPAIIWRRPRY